MLQFACNPRTDPSSAKEGKQTTEQTPGQAYSKDANPDTVQNSNEKSTASGRNSGGPFDSEKGLANGRYIIKPYHSRKCLTVPDASRDYGAVLEQAECDFGTQQAFDIIQVESGFYRITNVNSAMSLEVRDQVFENGTLVQQGNYFGYPYQQFSITADPDTKDALRIQSRLGEKFLDVAFDSYDDNVPIQIWERTKVKNQVWILNKTL